MKKNILAASLVLMFSACSSVQGVVRDKDTGSPIPSALVSIKTSEATTNALGRYQLTGSFIPGDTMLINAPGYNIYTRSVTSTSEVVDIDLTKQ